MRGVMRMVLLIAAAGILLAFSGAQARIVTHTGKCAGGGEWIIVVTIDDSTGRVTRLEGENCYGEHWVGHCGAPDTGTRRAGNAAIGGRILISADRRDTPAPGGRAIP